MNRRALAVSFAWIAGCVASLAAQCEPGWLPGDRVPHVVGTVNQLVPWDPDGAGPAVPVLVAAGLFTVGAHADVQAAFWDGNAWTRLPPLPWSIALPMQAVSTAAVWNGSLFVGGSFGGLYEWDGASWQERVSPVLIRHVGALCVFQGRLVVAGVSLLIWNGTPSETLFAGNFTFPGPGFPVPPAWGWARAAAVFNNVVYIGGAFDTAGGASSVVSPNLVIWNGSNFVATPGANAPVKALAVRNGAALTNSFLFAGGDFTAIGSGGTAVAVDHVARFSPATNTWSSFGWLTDCNALHVRSTGLTSYEVVASDDFRVRRWNAPTGVWDDLGDVNSPGTVRALATYGGQLYAGNTSTQAVKHYVNGAWQPVTVPGFHGNVRAVIDGGPTQAIGGDFGVRQGTPNAWNSLGTFWDGFVVTQLAQLPNGHIVAAGSQVVFGNTYTTIARWDGSTWHTIGGTALEVNALHVLADGTLVVGGTFPSFASIPTPYLARWNGSTWAGLGSGVDGPVDAVLQLANGDLVVGGAFLTAGGVAAPRIARWNGTTWSAIGSGSGFDGRVRSLTQESDGSLVAGGEFAFFSGQPVGSVARWNGSTWVAAGGTWPRVDQVLALPDDTLLVRDDAGDVFSLPGALPLGDFDYPVRTATLALDGDVLVGGDFRKVGAVVSAGVARRDVPCAGTAAPFGLGCTGPAGTNVLVATNQPFVGGVFRATATGLPAPSFALVVRSIAALTPSVPLTAVSPHALPGCELHVAADVVDLVVLPTGPSLTTAMSLPSSPAIAGTSFYQQVITLQLSPTMAISTITATNALYATVGSQ
jgi:hypothetical protein